ncbi:hypothetical protein OSB04_031667 [Centaurea solstitialis]|uniref:Uncharacterized protein n=1 Tax=Centaurea solstitialis TaxID=347529 RepID=A0AA38S9F0_9ASTR|nr:hypothetical protein OSB04_031667 [Centaurea solstitialis]
MPSSWLKSRDPETSYFTRRQPKNPNSVGFVSGADPHGCDPQVSYNIGCKVTEPCSNPPAPPPKGIPIFKIIKGIPTFKITKGFQIRTKVTLITKINREIISIVKEIIFKIRISNFQNKQAYQNRQPQQAESSNSMENWIKGFMTQTQTSLRNLETQISQLASSQANRPTGTLPSDTEVPRAPGKEHMKAMVLRSGKELEGPVPKSSETTTRKEFEPTLKSKPSVPLPTILEEPKGPSQTLGNTEPIPELVSISTQVAPIGSYHPFKENLEKPPKETKTTSSPQSSCSTSEPVVKPIPLYVPYPQRLRNQKEELQFKKFLDVFKELHINIPFVEAIEQMPLYAKFLKDILSKKKKLDDFETVAFTEGYDTLMTKTIPPKLKDPGCFTIPVSIGGKQIGKALCDLGASINLMPLSVFSSLGIGEVRPTSVTILLADKTIAYL